MRLLSSAAALGLAASLAACDGHAVAAAGPEVCPLSISVPTLEVEIRDAVTGAPLALGAHGTYALGSLSDSLTVSYWRTQPLDSVRVISRGAVIFHEGTYTVHVEHAGYQPWATAVVMRSNGCSIDPVHLEASLVRA